MNLAPMSVRFPSLSEKLKTLGMPHAERGRFLEAACADEDARAAAPQGTEPDDTEPPELAEPFVG
jgi:hypothetical protein